MDILEKILAHKITEVADRKGLYPEKLLQQSIYFGSQPVSLKKYLTREDKSGIIAEIKRKSPSKGEINPYVSIERTSIGYMQAGASALSILTDQSFFGGSNADLTEARKFNFCPLLRKEFIIDPYQIVEAKSIGADAILLIAAAITPQQVKEFTTVAHDLGLEVLLEVHNQDEFESHWHMEIDLVGVNNRNLKTFEVTIDTSVVLASIIPDDVVKISESGISDPQTIIKLKQYGFQGFLIGDTFMKNSRPEKACASLIEELMQIEHKTSDVS
ncbi:MAG: indole-3-glycerol phosphate synthase TrpC [Cyclobacteriaceae bacterium]